MHDRRRVVSLLLATLVTLVGLVASPAGAAESPADPCAGVDNCFERNRADVDGDGRLDRIGVVRVGEDGAEEGSVTVRLRTAKGKSVSAVRPTQYWFGPVVHGVATLDSKPGVELVLGKWTGAHTLTYQVLTWRSGRLVTLPAPGGQGWVIDGAASISLGWSRATSEPRGLLRKRSATPVEIGSERWIGTVTTFRHGDRGWRRVERTTRSINRDTAGTWVGWRIAGLPVGY